MTEKDKEINELRRENDRIKKTNAVLLNAFMKMIGEYNQMLSAVSRHSENIKAILAVMGKTDDRQTKN